MNFIAGGETSVHLLPEFRSDGRWDTGVIRNGRYATVQTYSLDPATLEQTSLCKAFDAANGRLTSGDPMTDQISRFGGDLVALENGNYVALVDDRSRLHTAAASAAVAAILAPDGSIVKDSFVIGPGDIWSNLAAFRGGFCVRLAGVFHFFDNDGNFQGKVDQEDPRLVDHLGKPIAFDRGRGDGTRIAAHINCPYVFLAGVVGSDVRIAAWDSRNRKYVAQTNVNELTPVNGGTDDSDFRPGLDRVNLAVDALGRVVVVYEAVLGPAVAQQTLARVLAFDAEEGTFACLTGSFFPFVNFDDGSLGTQIRTVRPSIAMTTREICIAAKGEINSANDPTLGADTPREFKFYTVFGHPDPVDDPTPPVGTTFFRRGDANADGDFDLGDAIRILFFIFASRDLNCPDAADTDDDGNIEISDIVLTLGYLYLGGAAPSAPFPGCGVDTPADGLTCEIFEPCQ